MDAAELTARLRPARLPEEFLAVGVPDLLAAFGLGLLAALLLGLVLRPLARRAPSRRARLHARLDVLRRLGPEARLLGQAELLAGLGGALEPEERAALYRRGGEVDHERIDRRIVVAAGRR